MEKAKYLTSQILTSRCSSFAPTLSSSLTVWILYLYAMSSHGCSSGFRRSDYWLCCPSAYIRASERSHRAASLWVRLISVAFGRSVRLSVRPSVTMVNRPILSWTWGVRGCCVIAALSYANSGGATPGRARSNDLTGRSIPSPWLRPAYC